MKQKLDPPLHLAYITTYCVKRNVEVLQFNEEEVKSKKRERVSRSANYCSSMGNINTTLH